MATCGGLWDDHPPLPPDPPFNLRISKYLMDFHRFSQVSNAFHEISRISRSEGWRPGPAGLAGHGRFSRLARLAVLADFA